jgi:hypothetical protein
MNQFGVRPEEREEIQGIFEWYVAGALLALVSAQFSVRTHSHGVYVSATLGGISSPISVRDSTRHYRGKPSQREPME